MKNVLTTTFLVAVLAIGILGMSNVFAQEGFQTEDLVNETIDIGNSTTSNVTLAFAQEGAITSGGMNNTMGNDTSMTMNATLPMTIISNATLAFAQEGFQTKDLVNETIDLGNNTGKMAMDSDDNKMTKLNGTINVEKTMAEAFKSKITTDIVGAIQAAQASIGPNSFVCSAELTPAHGSLVYKIMAADENMKIYKVIVDPGNGQVLMKKEVTWNDAMHDKMGYGDEKPGKYDANGHEGYDDKNKMMGMEDKKY